MTVTEPGEAWMGDALCREPAYATVTFFAERGEALEAARAVCAECLVRSECLAYAVAWRLTAGVWGGTSPEERRQLTTSS